MSQKIHKGKNTRIYELAKELQMSNRELIKKLNEYGVEVKSHMSSIDDETLEVSYAQDTSPAYKNHVSVRVGSKHGIKIHYVVNQ